MKVKSDHRSKFFNHIPVEKRLVKKTLQNKLKFPAVVGDRKIFRLRFVFVKFRESNGIWRFEQIVGVRLKCFGKVYSSLSM